MSTKHFLMILRKQQFHENNNFIKYQLKQTQKYFIYITSTNFRSGIIGDFEQQEINWKVYSFYKNTSKRIQGDTGSESADRNRKDYTPTFFALLVNY